MPNVRFKFGGAEGVAFANGEFTVAPSPTALKLLQARAGLTATSQPVFDLSADDVNELATAARTGTNIPPPS